MGSPFRFLLLFLAVTIVQIYIASWMNKRLHVKQPNTRPFTWGYWNGLCCFLLTPLLSTAALGVNALVASEVILIPLGVFVLLRRRWAFIAATVLSFNPVYYVVNAIYISKRWTEMEGR
jgi:hypothetical protein